MDLSKKEVVHVAKLAKLQLRDEEIEIFKDQLSNILNYIEELNEVDTSSVEPTSQTTGLVDILREDKIDATRILPIKGTISQAENTNNNFFVVPVLIDKQ